MGQGEEDGGLGRTRSRRGGREQARPQSARPAQVAVFLVDTGDAMSPELSRETRTALCALVTMLSSYQVRRRPWPSELGPVPRPPRLLCPGPGRFWGCPCEGRVAQLVKVGASLVLKEVEVAGGSRSSSRLPSAPQAVQTRGCALPGPETHSQAASALLTGVCPVSLPSQTLFHLFFFQILNTSQELTDTDLEYLEVRSHLVLGCHPVPA